MDVAEPLNPSELLQQRRSSKSPSRLDIRRFSKELFSLPKSPKSPKTKSSTSLDTRRFSSDLEENKRKTDLKTFKSSDVRLSAKDIRIHTSNAIGRRLSKDSSSWLSNSPPDLNSRRKSHLDIMHTKSLSVSENVLDDTPKSTLNLSTSHCQDQTKYNEYGKELLCKSMTLTPVISKAATIRLASSGSLDAPKPPKLRPRLPSPPKSPVMAFHSSRTPKISISDVDNLNLYDTILLKDETATKKPSKNSHSRSKSLDNKHFNFGATIVDIGTTDEKNNETDKQTVSYATLEHKRSNVEDASKSKTFNGKFANIRSPSASRERQVGPLEGRPPFGKNVPTPTIDTNTVKDFITPRNNTKDHEIKTDIKVSSPYKSESSSAKETQLYAEPQKIKKEKKEEKTNQGKWTEPSGSTSKPKVPPKNNALKIKQARACSAPEPGHKPTTVVFIPEDTFKKQTLPEYNYYSEHKKFQKSDSFPERRREVKCSERCFETFPTDRRCVPMESRRRSEGGRRIEMSGRSRSVPEQRCSLSYAECEERSKRKSETPILVMQHAASKSLDVPNRNPGILKNRRRSRSRDEIDLPPAPPTPPEKRKSNRRDVFPSKKQSHGYLEPP